MKQKINRQLQNAYSDGIHHMVRLSYVSQAAAGVSADELKRILEQARSNNEARGITGALLFNSQYFLQVIEGSRPAINDLLNALFADPRHHNVQVISVEQTSARKWTDWAMNYFAPSEDNNRELMRHSALPSFNPYLLTASNVEAIFDNLNINKRSTASNTEDAKETSSGKVFSLFSKSKV